MKPATTIMYCRRYNRIAASLKSVYVSPSFIVATPLTININRVFPKVDHSDRIVLDCMDEFICSGINLRKLKENIVITSTAYCAN